MGVSGKEGLQEQCHLPSPFSTLVVLWHKLCVPFRIDGISNSPQRAHKPCLCIAVYSVGGTPSAITKSAFVITNRAVDPISLWHHNPCAYLVRWRHKSCCLILVSLWCLCTTNRDVYSVGLRHNKSCLLCFFVLVPSACGTTNMMFIQSACGIKHRASISSA